MGLGGKLRLTRMIQDISIYIYIYIYKGLERHCLDIFFLKSSWFSTESLFDQLDRLGHIRLTPTWFDLKPKPNKGLG